MSDVCSEGAVGRFGHHPDPAIDFEVEVEELEAIAYNLRVGFHSEDAEPYRKRVERAMEFRVGGDPITIGAKAILRRLDADLRVPPAI